MKPSCQIHFLWRANAHGDFTFFITHNTNKSHIFPTSSWQAIPSQGETSITFAGLDSNPAKVTVYDFRRKALCAVNDAFSNVATVQVIPQMKLSTTTVLINATADPKVVATLAIPAKVTWKTSSGTVLKTEVGVKTSEHTFNFWDVPIAPGGSAKAFCEVDYGHGTPESKSITVTFTLGSGFIYDDDRNGKHSYPIAKMADGRYWMQTNLRRTDVAYLYPDGKAANAAAYGCLYSWPVAMAGPAIEGARGICPAGWHIPTDVEWNNLITKYGGMSSAGIGLQLPGFNMTLSGFGQNGSVVPDCMGLFGFYWSSTNETYYGVNYGLGRIDSGSLAGTSYQSSVRCIKD